ncbi:hypothetical protein [Streptomyces acidiscabies]|uniref:hypothetical protein n=1 Tax=Streptomyces acidiscabies TaxID=42234 RepID=UPI000966EF4E|nr:hypothetical protein [Streptomyces acidiscabies]GAV38207.1 hypothetical protein Saa2_01086 [Streptomyces acidiscabies]
MTVQPEFSDNPTFAQQRRPENLPIILGDRNRREEYNDIILAVAEMQHAHSQQIRELEMRILDLERATRFGVKEHEELREGLRKTTEQISSHLAAHTRGRTDVASTAHMEQETLASDISRLVQQRLHSLARKCVKRTEFADNYPQREQAPRLLGAICAILLPPGQPDLHQLRALLNIPDQGSLYEEVLAAYEEALRLRKATEDSSMNCVWETNCSPGAPVDLERQEVWPGCRERRTVRFLIAPGYSFNGQPFLLQQVFAGE